MLKSKNGNTVLYRYSGGSFVNYSPVYYIGKLMQNMQAPYELVKYVAENGRLPVVNFAAGGVATPADAALMMQLGKDIILHLVPCFGYCGLYDRSRAND